MSSTSVTVDLASKTHPIRIGSISQGYQIINTSDIGIVWLSSDPSATTGNGVPINGQTSIGWATDGDVWAALDTSTTAPVVLLLTNEVADWSPSPVKVVNISGPVEVEGTVGIDGPVAITGTVDIATGTIDATITGPVTISSGVVDIGNTVDTQQNSIRVGGYGATQGTTAPFNLLSSTIFPWMRSISLAASGGFCVVSVVGLQSGFIYADQIMVGDGHPLQVVPLQPACDTQVRLIATVAPTVTLPRNLFIFNVEAEPDIGLIPVVPQYQAPSPTDTIVVAPTSPPANTPFVVIPPVATQSIYLWQVTINVAVGGTGAVVNLIDTLAGVGTFWQANVGSGGLAVLNFSGIKMTTGAGLNAQSSVSQVTRVSISYAQL